jgi:hypothetical protein
VGSAAGTGGHEAVDDQHVERGGYAGKRGVTGVSRSSHPATCVHQDARRSRAQVGIVTDEEDFRHGNVLLHRNRDARAFREKSSQNPSSSGTGRLRSCDAITKTSRASAVFSSQSG